MKDLTKSELLNSGYECSICKFGFMSFGKMQEHILKDHLLNLKNPKISLP